MSIIIEDLRQILYSILNKGKVGTLSLGRKRRQRDLFFEPENSYLLNRGNLHKFVLSSKLKSLSFLTQQDLFDIANEVQETNETIPELLLRQNLIDQQLFEELIQIQVIEEMLDALFTCRGSFLFHEDLVPEDLIEHKGYAARISIDHKTFANRINKREQELSQIYRIIPSLEEIFIFTEKGLAEHNKGQNFEFSTIYNLIDGFRSVRKIVLDSPFYEITVLRQLADFLKRSLIKKTILPELKNIDFKNLSAKKAEQLIPYFKQAVKYSVNELKYRELLANIYEKAEHHEKAAAEYSTIGDHLLRMHKQGKALKIYARSLELAPSNPDVRNKIYNIFISKAQKLSEEGKAEEAIKMLQKARTIQPGRIEIYCSIATDLLKINDNQGIRELFDHAITYCKKTKSTELLSNLLNFVDSTLKNDLALNKKIINSLFELGQKEEAMKRMEKIALKHEELGEKQKALDIYTKMLKFDPERKDINTTIKSLNTIEKVKIHKSTLVKIAAAVFFLGITIYQAWMFFAFNKIADAKPISKQAVMYKSFAADHPLSLCSVIARARAKTTQQVIDRNFRNKEIQYERLFQKGQTYENLGDLKEAQRLYTEINSKGPAKYKKKAMNRIQLINEKEKKADELLKLAFKKDRLGNHKEAFCLMKKISSEYKYTSAWDKVLFPLKVESSPSGAEVQCNNIIKGKTPIVLYIRRDEETRLQLRLAKHETYETVLKVLDKSSLKIELSKSPNWKNRFKTTICNTPLIYNDLLYAACKDGKLRSYSLKDGKEQQEWSLPGATDITAGPILAGGKIMFATNDGCICSINKTEKIHIVQAGGLIKSNLIGLDDSSVCFSTTHNKIRRISSSTGRIQWEVKIPSPPVGNSIKAADTIIFFCKDNTVRVFSQETGRFRWERKASQGTKLSCWGNLLLIGEPHEIVITETNWGYEYWKKSFKEEITNILLWGGEIWLSFKNGKLIKLDSHSGKTQKTVQLDDVVTDWCLKEQGILTCLEGKRLIFLDRYNLGEKWYFKPAGKISSISSAGDECFITINSRALISLSQEK